MKVAVVYFPDHAVPVAIHQFENHKDAVKQLKERFDLEGYLLIKRSDVTLLRTQTNTRSVECQFLQILPESYLSNVETRYF